MNPVFVLRFYASNDGSSFFNFCTVFDFLKKEYRCAVTFMDIVSFSESM